MVLPLSARQLALCTAACLGLSLTAILPATAQAQQSPATLAEYESAINEISSREATLAIRRFYLSQQQAEIDKLTAEIQAASERDASQDLMPLVRNMVAELEKEMNADLPIDQARRFALLDDLRDDMQAEDVLVFEVYRRAMDLIGDEVTYGLQVGSYIGNNPINPGTRYAACEADQESVECALSDDQKNALKNGAELFDLRDQIADGNYIHYGRMALLYLERDSSEGYRYNETSGEWDRLSNSELLGLRQNVRIARGESAISTMVAPIRVGSGAADAS